ncbi:MAG: transglutaminase domain-containing protein [Acetatifactor sp.]|nr:transglutaminase domain-containing protein [Acetatifactor sp.]
MKLRQLLRKPDPKKILANCSIFLLPFLLVLTLTFATMSVFEIGLGVNGATILVALGLIPLFALCRFTEKHRFIGGFLVTVVVIASMMLLGYLLAMGRQSTGIFFQQWMLTAGTEAEGDDLMYRYGLLFGCAVFFGFSVYYFAIVLYRTSFLMLVSLLPCVFYAKVLNDIDNMYLVLLATINVAIFLMNLAKKRPKARQQEVPTQIAAAGVFVFILFLVCAAIPKEKDARYYDRFEDLFLGGDTRSDVSSDFSELGLFSGNADYFRGEGNRRLFTLYGTGANTYLKRQNFDYYDFKKDRWYADPNLAVERISPEEWKNSHESLSLENLQRMIWKAEEYEPGFAFKHRVEAMIDGERIVDEQFRLQLYSLNFGAVYYLAPTRAFSVQASDTELFHVTHHGTFYRTSGKPHDKSFSYNIYFYGDVRSRTQWLEAGYGNLNDGLAESLLFDLWTVLKEHEDEKAEDAADWYAEYSKAAEYRELCKENNELISEELRSLAEELTRTCVFEWEKAYALQDFFQSEDFKYDLEFRDRDTSPEHFVFETKTGTCSDYASAYVLMARAAGLTVRYAEGFVPEFSSRDNIYHIKDGNSHAYPEVYLPGMGWMVFEPTSSRVISDTKEERSGLLDSMRDWKVDYGLMGSVSGVGAFLVALVAVVRFLFPGILELLFRIRIRIMEPKKSIVAIYGRMVKRAKRKMIPGANCLTPREFAEKLAEKGLAADDFAGAVERYLYGEILPGQEEKKEAVALYGAFAKKLYARKKK